MTEGFAEHINAQHSYPEDAYDGLDLNRLTVFAIGWLRESRTPPSFENIVAALFKMFPTKFSLRGFEYPDSNRVNRALLQLGPKYRNWARGSTRTGYALTPLGELVLKEASARLNSSEPASARTRKSSAYTWDPGNDLVELRATSEFARYVEGGPTALVNDDVANALSAFAYTPQEAVRSRLITLRDYATRADDGEVAGFIDALRERFEAMVLQAKRGGARRA